MAQTTALLSCERCSRRKQACDRLLPTCSRCLKAGAQCQRPQNEVNMTQTRDGDVQRKSPVALLQERLAYLQAVSRRCSTGNQEPADPRASAAPLPVRPLPRAMPDLGHGASELSLGLLSLGAMAEPTRRAGEVLPELSLPRIICSVTEIYGGNPEHTRRLGEMWDGIAKNIRRTGSVVSDRFVVPRQEALSHLVAYFDTVDFRYPRLSREEVSIGIEAITTEDHQQYAASVSSSPAAVFMAYMVIAIVPLISESYPGAQASFISIQMLSQALKLLDTIFQLEDGIDIIQCLRLLVIFSLHSSAAGSSWHLVSFAVKKCVALGFHREGYKPASHAQRRHLEQRRWAFWSCYLLDRLICTALDRPYSISDMYITVKFPGEDREANEELTAAEFRQIHLYRYAVLMSEVTQDSGRRLFHYHLSHLIHWKASAPEELEPYPQNQAQHLASLYHTLLLRITIDQLIFDKRNEKNDVPLASLPWTPESPQSSGSRSMRTPALDDGRQNVTQMKLLATCQAVVRSLTRVDMKHRSVLSWITGYSATSAALGLLYWASARANFTRGSVQRPQEPRGQPTTPRASEAAESALCDESETSSLRSRRQT